MLRSGFELPPSHFMIMLSHNYERLNCLADKRSFSQRAPSIPIQPLCVSFHAYVCPIKLVNHSSFVTELDYSLKDSDNDGFNNASSFWTLVNV